MAASRTDTMPEGLHTCAMWLARRTDRRRMPSLSLRMRSPTECRRSRSSVTLADLKRVPAAWPGPQT